MKDGKLNSLLGRRVMIVMAIGGLLTLLLALYYFVYAPHQKNFYNKTAFRILKSISQNFTQRVKGYDTSGRINIIPKADMVNLVGNTLTEAEFRRLAKTFNQRLDVDPSSLFGKKDPPDTAGIMAPIVSIRNNLFESIILAKSTAKSTAKIMYKSGSLDVDEIIIIDSLLKNKNGFTFPTIADVSLEGVNYKLFLYPFRIYDNLYLLGGFINNHDYQISSNRFPLPYILSITILIIAVLLIVPILKIFLIGSFENISINDVRAIIAMIFITPFLFILFNWAIWITKAEGKKTESSLRSLHKQVIKNFHQEIAECLKQLRSYDSLYNDPVEYTGPLTPRLAAIPAGKQIEFRDLLFYPKYYKNIDVVFWMNNKGEEITKWYFQKNTTRYFNKSERQYFKDINRNEAFRIPGDDTTSFSIQPTLSLVTGEYTINIVKHSDAVGNADKEYPAYIGLSSKLYSVYEPVVSKGLNFCIINVAGDILYHSESNRNLQENIFAEVNDNQPLKLAISNRDSSIFHDLRLYDKDSKLLVSPIEGLPYYLVTYSDQRNQILFTRHIIAFAFLCESLVLLLLSIFILFYYFVNKRFSELFFSPHLLDWIKPSYKKRKYYILIIRYQLALLMIIILAAFSTGDQIFNYILNVSFLLPFFVVLGYYLIRAAENNAILFRETHNKENRNDQEQKRDIADVPENKMEPKENKMQSAFSKGYLLSILKIIIPYLFMMFLFTVIKEDLREKLVIVKIKPLENLLFFLKILIPSLGIGISAWRYYRLTSTNSYHDENHSPGGQGYGYLNYLLTGLIISIILISIVPTFGFIIYANKQESSLQVKSNQMHLAKKIQQRRKTINDKADYYNYSYGSRPLQTEDAAYLKSMKFNPDYGLYLDSTEVYLDRVVPTGSVGHAHTYNRAKKTTDNDEFINYDFYKQITNYLFMPADHFEYFNNTADYKWRIRQNEDSTGKSLLFYSANAWGDRDYFDPSTLILSSELPGSFAFVKDLNGYDISLQVFSLISLVAALSLLIYYASKRIFLIGYFEKSPGKEQDFTFLDKIFNSISTRESDPDFWGEKKVSRQVIMEKEEFYPVGTKQYDECILKIQHLLSRHYERIWNLSSLPERSVLYDFALDGFTNYKNVNILYPLYRKGISKKENHHLVMMSASFRNFLIAKSGSPEISELQKAVSEGGKWGNLSSLLYILLFAVIIFLFIVQEEVSNRILAIVTSLGALIPILLKLFNSTGPKKSE